jgi:hypothetical protein
MSVAQYVLMGYYPNTNPYTFVKSYSKDLVYGLTPKELNAIISADLNELEQKHSYSFYVLYQREKDLEDKYFENVYMFDKIYGTRTRILYGHCHIGNPPDKLFTNDYTSFYFR